MQSHLILKQNSLEQTWEVLLTLLFSSLGLKINSLNPYVIDVTPEYFYSLKLSGPKQLCLLRKLPVDLIHVIGWLVEQ